MKTRNMIWGVFFIAAAGLLVANQLGYFMGINFWSLLLTVMLLPVVISGLRRRNFFNFFFGIALLLIIYAGPLGIMALVPWTILVAALLLSIGFSILIPGRYRFREPMCYGRHRWEHTHYRRERETVDHVEGNELNCRVSLSGSCKYLHSDSLQSGHFECSLGYLKAYFDNVKLHPDGATITVDCSMGSMELYVPANWKVVLNIDTVLGNVEERQRGRNAEHGSTLTIKGTVQLGSLVIVYI